MNKSILTQDIVRELLDYDPESGKLTWKLRSSHWFKEERNKNIFNKIHAGKCPERISLGVDGYPRIRIGVLGNYYSASRVIWLWMTGEWPTGIIDHIDKEPTNNKWDNLRQVDSLGNARNRSKQSNNTSGVTGVSWSEEKQKWRAGVRIKGKQRFLGYFKKEDLDLAAMEVMEFRAENGFHTTHGAEIASYLVEDI